MTTLEVLTRKMSTNSEMICLYHLLFDNGANFGCKISFELLLTYFQMFNKLFR